MPARPDDMPARARQPIRRVPRARRSVGPALRWPKGAAPPVLVEQVRGGIVESRHRGHVVQVGADGRIERLLGDPEQVVTLRSSAKPFGLVALVESGAADRYALTPPELAILASSHSGEDLHVRTLHAIFRRAGVGQGLLACGTEGMPLDRLTAARLAGDRERPGPVRHMCSGQHAGSILLSKFRGWPLETYWEDDHPSQVAFRGAVARVFGVRPERLVTAIDGCGLLTYAFPLVEVARAYALLADPAAATGERRVLAPALTQIRDAMLAAPEMVGGTRERLDTALMKSCPGLLVAKAGMEALRGVALLPDARGPGSPAAGLALSIEDGDGYDRGSWAATVEAVRQVGALDAAALRTLATYHHPPSTDPRGRVAAEAIPRFELAPVSELL